MTTHPRWQRRHEGVLLWLLQHPAGTLRECAAATGYSKGQISRIVNSPVFVERYRSALGDALRVAAVSLLRQDRHDPPPRP
jgi:hypothetical protein